MYRFVLWLVPAVEKFPRRQKFLLGDRLQATALDVLERLVEATYTRDRRRHLVAANLRHSRSCGFLCRLAKDLGHLDERRYEHAARSLDETGQLIRRLAPGAGPGRVPGEPGDGDASCGRGRGVRAATSRSRYAIRSGG